MDKYDQMVKEYSKLIEYEASKYAQFVPLSVVQSEAYKLARKAAETFNPNAGVKYSTYLTNALKKLSRISTKYGGAIRIPENKQFQLNKINKIEAELRDTLNRPASMHELSEATGLNLPYLNNLMQNRRKEVNMNNIFHTPVFVDDGQNDEWITFVYHDLTEKDKIIFEHKTGYGNKKILNNQEIADLIHVSPSTVAVRVKHITDKLREGFK